MKKAKSLLLVAMAGVMVAGLSGCGAAPSACNILVEDAKINFEIGEEFSLSNEMELNLVFTNNDVVSLGGVSNLSHDIANKKYIAANYIIDYSSFDSSKGGPCPIFITYNDGDANKNNDFTTNYTVQVQRYDNSWVQQPQISSSWTYGETPTFVEGQVESFNDNAEYYYKLKSSTTYSPLNKSTLLQDLKALNAGEYDFFVLYPQTDTVNQISTTLSFTINRIALDASVVPSIPNATYTGEKIYPFLEESPYFSYEYSEASNFMFVGKHNVILTLKNFNYKWADSDATNKIIEFEITAAENHWISNFDVPSVGNDKGWLYGQFDKSDFVAPVAEFGKVLYKYKDQGAEDSTYKIISIEELSLLNVGAYTLQAYVQSNTNYASPTPILINFVVVGE